MGWRSARRHGWMKLLAEMGAPGDGRFVLKHEVLGRTRRANASHADTQKLIMYPHAAIDVPELLTSAEVAALLKVNRSTLSRWRSVGTGPRVTWLSANIPRYQRADIIDWLQRASA